MATPVTQATSPWQPIAEQLKYGYLQARNIYDGGGPAYYPHPTYVGLSSQTRDALDRIESRATAGSPLAAAAQGAVTGLLGADALSANPASAYLHDVAGGRTPTGPAARYATGIAGGQASNPALAAAAGLAAGGGSGFDTLRHVGSAGAGPGLGVAQGLAAGGANPAHGYAEAGARGDYLASNPYLDAMYDRAARQVRDRVNAQFAHAGRASSGAHADLLSRGLGDLAGDIYGRAYESERERQLRSQDLLAQLGQQRTQNRLAAAQAANAMHEQALARRLQAAGTDIDRRLSAASLQGQLAQNDRAAQLDAIGALQGDYAQRQANRLAAAGRLGQLHADAASRQLAAAQLAPQLAASDYADLQQLLSAGRAREQQRLTALRDKVQRHNFEQSADADRLAQFMALLNGTAGSYRTTQSYAPEPGTASRIIGGLHTGADLASGLGSLLDAGGDLLSLFD